MKQILDACCGSRMFWFDKDHHAAIVRESPREGNLVDVYEISE